MIATGIVQGLLQVLQNHARNASSGFAAIAGILSIIIGIIVALGWAKVTLMLNRSDRGEWDAFKTDPKLWLKYIKAAVWYAVYVILWVALAVLPFAILAVVGIMTDINAVMVTGVVLGSIALVLTTIYFSIRYQFLAYVVVDNPEIRSRDTVQMAGAMTKGRVLELLGFGIVCGLVNLLGLICLVVGLVATIPAVKLAQARVYDFLKSEHEKHSARPEAA